MCIRDRSKAQQRRECVKPRCASKVEVGSIHIDVTKSMSGTLWAAAPQSMAFLPSCFPAKASPIHAPNAMWVMESIPF